MKMLSTKILGLRLLGFSIIVALAALIPGLVRPQGVGATSGTEITRLPFQADIAGETYYLSQDLTGVAGEHGIIVGANGVVIDGNGYKITGSKTPASSEWASEADPSPVDCGVYNNGFDDVVIMNLEVENFSTGIALHGTGPNRVEGNTIDNCEIHDNGFSTQGPSGSEIVTHGIHACHIGGLSITNNDIYNNEGTGIACGDGGNGIFIYAGSPEDKQEAAIISGNKLHDNAKAGFWTKMMLSYSEITNNEAWGNGYGSGITDDVRGGIVLRCKLSDDNTISGNNVHDNDVDGIFIGGFRNTIEGNTSSDNARYGINISRSDGSCDNTVLGNEACDNGAGDINIGSDVTGNSGDNNTCDSTGNYDDDGTTGCTHDCNAGEAPADTETTEPEEPDNADNTGTPGETTDLDNTDTTEETAEPETGGTAGRCGEGTGPELAGMLAAVGCLTLMRKGKK
jgi:hypothetical protein